MRRRKAGPHVKTTKAKRTGHKRAFKKDVATYLTGKLYLSLLH